MHNKYPPLSFKISFSPSGASSWLRGRRSPWCSPRKPPCSHFTDLAKVWQPHNLHTVAIYGLLVQQWCSFTANNLNNPPAPPYSTLKDEIPAEQPYFLSTLQCNGPNLIGKPDTPFPWVLPGEHTCTSRHGSVALKHPSCKSGCFLCALGAHHCLSPTASGPRLAGTRTECDGKPFCGYQHTNTPNHRTNNLAQDTKIVSREPSLTWPTGPCRNLIKKMGTIIEHGRIVNVKWSHIKFNRWFKF